MTQRVQISVLGHLEASVDDHPVALGGAKQRAVLAMLGLEANHTVSADRLIEGLWGEEPPASAAKMVQNYVWRLRGALGDDGAEILTHGRGYELRIDSELVDACRLERLVAEAARAAEAGEPGHTARAALALFRGAPLADVADEPFAGPEIRRLEELRLNAAELAIDADLAAGRHQEVVPELDALLADNPLRERLHAQRMLALYRCGRQGEALDAFRHARATLVEEIGVEPAPELRRLHEAILRQDPSLDVEPAPVALQPELDPAALPPLIGRDAELGRLRACLHGSGALVALVGTYGMGKTRLAAEIAGEAHREGTAVFYAAGSGPPEAALAALARARESRRPALVVVDDADRAPVAVRAALRDLANADAPVVALATGLQAAALARLEPDESIVLDPLDAAAVLAIAGFYAPAGGTVPVDALLDASRGVPRRIHEAASDWARAEATRRVDTAADRAAHGRSEARVLEAELAGSVEELQSTRERAGLLGGDGAATPVVCPYKGLSPFEADDAEYFFGRERLVAELVARLVGASLLAVVGPSGSGKSSAVRAGLLPALAGGVLPGSHNWTQALIRPGEHPARELSRATRRLARHGHRVLVVDQFEELFTACSDEAERGEFVAALVRFARDGGVVVVAIRADFYGRCAAYPELSRLLGANHVLVGPLSRDELRRAIERPAERVGLTVEPELAEALLSDVDGQPGALPLLSTALLELWRERDQRRLRLAAYARSGGVQGAVARLAESAYVALDLQQQAAARRLMLRLTDEGDNGTVVRRRLALADLDAELSAVVAQLSEQRLLTVSDGAVEVAHEALLREWPRLRGWLDEDVQGRRVHRRLSDAARAWDADGRDPASLYRGGRLASVADWAAEHGTELDATERAFLDDSRRATGRAQRRLRAVLAGVVALLVLAVIAGVVALDQRSSARTEATTAAAQRLGAQALADDDLGRSLLLARQGMALDDTLQTRSNLLAALLRTPAAVGVLRGDGDRLLSVAQSPDGRTLAMVDVDGTLSLFDTRTRRLEARENMPGFLGGWDMGDPLRFSDDGRRLAVGGSQPMVLDTRTLKVVMARTTDDVRLFYALSFTPDGRTIVAGVAGPGREISVQRFALPSGRPLGLPHRITRRNLLVTPMLTHDGARVITTLPGRTDIRDATSLRVLRTWPVGAEVSALSPDDRTLLLGGTDGSVRFLDLESGAVRTASGRHAGPVVGAAFGRDGRVAVTSAEDNRVIVWDVGHGAITETLEGHAGPAASLVISSDGRTLYTGGRDGKVLIWDLAGERRLDRRLQIGAVSFADFPFMSSALSGDGHVLAAGHPDGTVSLIDVATLRTISTFRSVPRGAVRGLGYIPHTGLLVVGGDYGYLAIFDPDTGRLVQRLRGRGLGVEASMSSGEGRGSQVPPSFSADGRVMATADLGGDVLLWKLRAGHATGAPRAYGPSLGTQAMSLSPDGKTLVLSAVGVEVVDVATLRRRAFLPGVSRALVVQFAPDGSYVIAGSANGRTQAWSAKTWQPVGGALAGHTGEVWATSVSPDSRTVATGSSDGTIRLYDAGTQELVGAPLPAVPNRPVSPMFTADGAYLLAITATGQAYRWDVQPSAWARRACAVAGRTLTRAEWNDALPGRKYAPACTS